VQEQLVQIISLTKTKYVKTPKDTTSQDYKWQLQFTLRPPIPGVRAELQTKQVHAYASWCKLESRVVLYRVYRVELY
jgi:hypothetical protein